VILLIFIDFPHLTVGQTLEFAAAVRAPQTRVNNVSRAQYVEGLRDLAMAIFGLSHTVNTKVGDDFVRGVSGGERKRVSIAEMFLSRSPIACWDNSTRGLDAATALDFVKSLRLFSDLIGATHAVAIYQASQAIYDVFDKAIVLYEGRQIFFGPTGNAKAYFERMGWFCPARQTTGDFLTSVTNPQERKAREGFEAKVPRTPDEFEKYWKESEDYVALKNDMAQHEEEFPIGAGALSEFKASRKMEQSNHTRQKSPYTVSVTMQIKLCTKRAYQRLWNDKTSTLTTIIGMIGMALIIGSIFYGTASNTQSFVQKGGVLFFAVLLNALISLSEINSLFAQRPIVEKQASYAFYHPFAEAMAGIVSDIPVKIMISICFNIILYFLAGLRTEPSQFFIFLLFAFTSTLLMSFVFRTIAAASKTVSQALAMAGVLVLAIVIYTGFVIPRKDMHPWFKWISWINPVAYTFEGMLINEFHGRDFACSSFVPADISSGGETFICSITGAIAGQLTVSGDSWAAASYGYSYSHIWRNLGFMFAFLVFFLALYLIITELNSKSTSAAEFLVFRRGHVPKHLQQGNDKAGLGDEEDKAVEAARPAASEDSGSEVNVIPPQTDIFSWKDVVYDIEIKGEPRRLLDHISGWVKPGTLTALMGVSGAGEMQLFHLGCSTKLMF
jgi:ATP-binding cassette, subfamily G (WHITE), member 2, PDR